MAEQALDLSEAISLYLDLDPDKRVDLEVAAAMAIQWSRAVKAAGTALDSEYDYRVSLITAKPGSSNWLAKLERSKINRIAKRVHKGWEEVPLILRWTIALVVVVPGTAVPTWHYWMDDDTFSPAEMQQMSDAFQKAIHDEDVRSHKRKMFKEAQRDRKITAIGGGVPDGPQWTPKQTVPANQFAEADGLFELQEDRRDRTIHQELDVILVSPDLENAHKTWIFKQEGIPGTIRAVMKDDEFLAALERSAVRERFRTEIPMKIRLAIKERREGGRWRVVRGGRSVVEVISPEVL
jgi:hypothetical protein